MPKLYVLTGAGMSAESGIKTFRDSDGLWEEYDVMTVASIDGWYQNPELVLRFYNDRRKQLATAKPNAGHIGLAELQKYFEVHIITQNIDNLHEAAGSKNVLHLHGELTKVRSTIDPSYIKDIGYNDINLNDKCPKGGQLRPHIVWFGEAVPAFEEATDIVREADAFAIIGTSMNVYPAAGLINYVPTNIPVYLIDPKEVNAPSGHKVEYIKEKAGTGVEILKQRLLKQFGMQ
jgi:NAD-dependent deacetylase